MPSATCSSVLYLDNRSISQAPMDERVSKRLREESVKAESVSEWGILAPNLVSLSDETIKHIIQSLDDATVHALAFTCHRLHRLLLPEYFERKKETLVFPAPCPLRPWSGLPLTPMHLWFSTTERYRCIPLLRASPMVKFLKELWFRFKSGEYDDMQQAASLMQTVAVVDELCLMWTLRDVIDENPVEFNALSALTLAQMLDGLSGKTIKYIDIRAFNETSTSAVSIDSENFPFTEVVSCKKIVTTFEHVSISLPILGLKHFRLWAIGSFNASPLKRLTLRAHHLPEDAWTELFFGLNLPVLDYLRLDIDSLRSKAFAVFLINHPSLIYLHIEQDLVDADVFCLPCHALPNLRDVTGMTSTIARILRNPSGLPAIECIRTMSGRGLRTRSDLLNLAECMEALAARPVRRQLKLIHDVESVKDSARPPEPPVRTVTNEEGRVIVNPAWTSFWESNKKFCTSISRDENQNPCVDVDILEVALFWKLGFTTAAHYTLDQWLNWCPNVHRIVLLCHWSQYTIDDRDDLLDKIWTHFPSVKVVEIEHSRGAEKESYTRLFSPRRSPKKNRERLY
ncbi:hypothetical protein NEOLEDRAFT_1244774 [Neolentinus lepideus HHB14362 ss-1]|uniref:Uncharacterized protein n=1 Tax=Neolentinus lepideus HHB14362 ss-1 TaxID=1314782 RepID=A0A165PHD4_9AGAM|nr:hypothetical protein NEOLEDRAFT_1244774 [Neolentinus lepideus HHB14362 ss-1]